MKAVGGSAPRTKPWGHCARETGTGDGALADYPRTYSFVRAGNVQTVTVEGPKDHLHLRTEVEILLRFGLGCNDRVVEALDTLAKAWEAAGDAKRDELPDLLEICQILKDARLPIARECAAAMDADEPETAAALPLETIQQEAESFHWSVAERIRSMGGTEADALAQEYWASAEGGLADPLQTTVTRQRGADVKTPETSDNADAVLAEAEAMLTPDLPDPTAEEPADGGIDRVTADEVMKDLDESISSALAVADDRSTSEAAVLSDSAVFDGKNADAVVPEAVGDAAEEVVKTAPAHPPLHKEDVGGERKSNIAIDEPCVEALSAASTAEASSDSEVLARPLVDEGPTKLQTAATAIDVALETADAALSRLTADIGTDTPTAPAATSTTSNETDLAADLRSETLAIRSVITEQMNRFLDVLERLERTQQQIQASLTEYRQIRQAAEAVRDEALSALQAQKEYEDAQRRVESARLAAEEAQNRLQATRKTFEAALADKKS